jgi:hypothetical protein
MEITPCGSAAFTMGKGNIMMGTKTVKINKHEIAKLDFFISNHLILGTYFPIMMYEVIYIEYYAFRYKILRYDMQSFNN